MKLILRILLEGPGFCWCVFFFLRDRNRKVCDDL